MVVLQTVRQKFVGGDEGERKWHLHLADYYKRHCADRGFLVHDYPHHLIQARENKRSEDCACTRVHKYSLRSFPQTLLRTRIPSHRECDSLVEF